MSCGGIDLIDDYVPPVLRITTPLTQLTLGNTFQFEASYFNNVGELVTNSPIEWESTNNEILSVDGAGNIEALTPGTATLTVSALVSTSIITSQSFIYVIEPIVAMVTSFSGELVSKSNYKLVGGFYTL